MVSGGLEYDTGALVGVFKTPLHLLTRCTITSVRERQRVAAVFADTRIDRKDIIEA
jgi:hypothetical protein